MSVTSNYHVDFHYVNNQSKDNPLSNHIPVNEFFYKETGKVASIITNSNPYLIEVLDKVLKKNILKVYKKNVIGKTELIPMADAFGGFFVQGNIDNKIRNKTEEFLYELEFGVYIFVTKNENKPSTKNNKKWFLVKNNKELKEINFCNIIIFYDIDKIEKAKKIEKIISNFEIYSVEEKTPKINILNTDFKNHSSLDLNTPEIDLKLNYGKDFEKKYNKILERLLRDKDKGILILHGEPGTGKTTLIRYLLSEVCKNKSVFFVPKHMAEMIGTGEFINYMVKMKGNSILVLEDCENIIKTREGSQGSSNAISNLLSLSDGLLSDGLGIQIICTFNTKISNIDSALLREGRLIAEHYFDLLEPEHAQNLSNKLGFKSKITKRMSLAQVYNQDNLIENENEEKPTKKRIGFSNNIEA